VQLEAEVVDRLMALVEQHPDLLVTVDLEARELRAADLLAPFPLDDFTRWRLMEGLDDIDLTLRAEHEIGEYEAKRAAHLPTTRVGTA
jgi:3-isopropylmalate/(R)-2-methylmalate dehydratase small subunit